MISPREEIWAQVLEILKLQLSAPAFETWFATTTLQELRKDAWVIQAENSFVLNHLQRHYRQMLANAAEQVMSYPVTILLTVNQEGNVAIFGSEPPNDAVGRSRTLPLVPLNDKYTFTRFVVGPTNRMAHAASLAVAESPGREFNPLFLCGGVGLGKTHLMQAIAHYRLEMYPDNNIFYLSTEQFTNDLIAAIRQDEMENFRQHYRSADLLLIDDVQFIEGKEYTQEEIFHTFNSLHQTGKQVVLASDRPPKRILTLQDRLISRFSMGLIADIQVPDLETRMAILQKKAEYENVYLQRDAIQYIATHYTSNIREMEGALTRAIAYTNISGLPMTVENLASVLHPPADKAPCSPEIILQIVSEWSNVSIGDLKGSSRRREISFARQVGMYLMRQHTDLSLPRIGEEFGGKDHTTVMYSCTKITKLQKEDWELSQTLTELSDRIYLAGQEF